MAIVSQLVDRSVDEIEELWQKAEDGMNYGSQSPDMSFEQSVWETLRWLWEGGENPLPGE